MTPFPFEQLSRVEELQHFRVDRHLTARASSNLEIMHASTREKVRLNDTFLAGEF